MQPNEHPSQDKSALRAMHSEPTRVARRSVVRSPEDHSVSATRAQADRMRQRLRVAAAETILSKNPEPRQFFESSSNPVLGSTDPRWILAKETARVLAGTVLPYERRLGLMALAQRLGIRAFDANLIVAVVQDRARRGEPLALCAPTLAMIPMPQKPTAEPFASFITVAIVIAIAVDAVLIGWLLLS